MRRRSVLVGSAALLAVCARARATPNEMGVAEPFMWNPAETIPTLDEFETNRGRGAPNSAEIASARKIIGSCALDCRPVEVAEYFLAIREGLISDFDGEILDDAWMFCEEWPVRANPVIVQFFDATTLRKPSGDQTPWCAAFVNWCIERGRKNKARASEFLSTTKSAASATFRSWGQKTDTPFFGDLVVFKHRSVPSRGHVGFYVKHTQTHVFVLGGNQMPLRVKAEGAYERVNTGEINVKRIPFDGSELQFHSFRTDNSLHA
ncbi:CHAP domain-containing protein [Mesorhizobium sp. M6A.T.Cr.TU.017.01.1.1]|uniref:CHAP domain-containing protein n=1 Tax=Mesorhizobium sp. M6A.T.Cr.TU.017.01.1.1 TaxID=2496774 RepID=UPI000FD4C3B0|nr:CHAP domain-containing protein [Mesorhizobium sp. M6A.T.Cr.TU.017.01.1.1]RUV04130.1 CHAP domain-containing protein [Mesorhizobium sp. M6A.T.Cr.TU.017.01.1.1]